MNDFVQKVVVERLIPAPPRNVFEAWLDPDALRQFMFGQPGARVTRAECDPRVGGQFLIVMNVGGKDIPHRGVYLEIERYTRLSFTWLSPSAGEGSRVTLHFAEGTGGHTRITLEHVGLPDAGVRASHHDGWSNIMTELAEYAESVK